MLRTRIVYSRAVEEYLLVPVNFVDPHLEAIKTWPKGQKADAEVFQLQHEVPDIAALVAVMAQNHPELKGRVFRGGQILANGGVQQTEERYFLVNSQTHPDAPPYRVSLSLQACSCPDWENGTYGHQYGAPIINNSPLCKHLVAAIMFLQLQLAEGENHE